VEVLNINNEEAGFQIEFRCAVFILGISKPLVVELTSIMAEESALAPVEFTAIP